MRFIVFLTGAAGYSMIEYLYTEEFKDTPTLTKAAVGALIFTGFEFAVGIVVNVWFGWDVWNYSRQIGNVMGQICPKYTLAWFIICLTLLSVWEIIGMAVKGGPPLDQNRKVL